MTVFRRSDPMGTAEAETETRELNRFDLPSGDGLQPATAISTASPVAAIVGTSEILIQDLIIGITRTIPMDRLDGILGVAFSPSGDRLAVAAFDLFVFDIATGQRRNIRCRRGELAHLVVGRRGRVRYRR